MNRRLIREAGLYADRLSVNIELPSEASLSRESTASISRIGC